MNREDETALSTYWWRETNFVNEKVDAVCKSIQDHAYELGRKRGAEDAKARYEPRPPLTDERIDSLAERMPGGIDGFLKQWGWRQFARAIEADHGIVEE